MTDTRHAAPEALAKRYFPDQSAIVRRLGGGFAAQQMVGVVADVTEANLTDSAKAVRYFLAKRALWFRSNATLVIRTAPPSATTRPSPAA